MEKIIAGIITYNPELKRFKENIDGIYYQVDEILIIDNGSLNINEIKKILKDYKGIELIQLNINMGIATALNIFINMAFEKKYLWALTLDQDSVCKDGLICKYQEYLSNEDIGILTCNIEDRNFIEKQSFSSNEDFKDINYCITSASLMNVNITKKIGGFDDKMFIDKVDVDICMNMIKHKYLIRKINFNGLLHEVGTAKQINLFFRKYEVYNHSVIRRYYMTRNASYLLKKYKNVSSFWCFLKEVFHIFMVFIFEDNKKVKLTQSLKGIFQGFFI